ncbi:uncharacterized protein MYCFIDRAFT_212449 [Pseudocercospora fijiensis CIRAD86]|uniref:Uncharacterized protein n=1 Tax=Pseudocercospora fijiensis (strain CIRAD86) TaxID=383855 RepID=M2YLR1_PSEFD|nr:uncharacterized protein MYCFIDRAFT_212449 [Pseudocercospora fijiensis CIRAD86]EME78670.1 hypothetical protein MYCFIDRAFT_212449 [Pseudocercospora fijiensis CIRAD86]
MTLTLRNAIRHLQKQDCFPVALQTENLLALSSRLLRGRQRYEDRATELFYSIPATLDLASGSVSFSLSPDFKAGMGSAKADRHVLALLLRKLLLLVAPHRSILLTELDMGIDLVFSNLGTESLVGSQYLHIAEVNIHRSMTHEEGRAQFRLQRARPIRHRSSDFELCWPEGEALLERGIRWSQWILWDNRYWIRVGHFGEISPDPGLKIAVTFLDPDHIAKTGRSLRSWQSRLFHSRLRTVPSLVHNTLPALITKRPVGGDVGTGVVEEDVDVMAIPTLRWNNPKYKLSDHYWQHDEEMRKKLKSIPLWVWEIRYREVDFSGKEHKFVDSTMKPERAAEKESAEEPGSGEEPRLRRFFI